MSQIVLSFRAELYRELRAHLAPSDQEQVAFLFTEPWRSNEPLRVQKLYCVPPTNFDLQSAYHVTLADEVRGDVIRRAFELGGCLVEAHSHLGGAPAAFSSTDLAGFAEWVPHVLWRLARRPYLALVFAGETFDALVWREAEAPEPLVGLTVDGGEVEKPTGMTQRRLMERRRR
jgi:hypothetical protein